jgi:hypothetical protein
MWTLAGDVELPAWATDPSSGLMQAWLKTDPTGIEPARIGYDLTTYTGTAPEVELLRVLAEHDMGAPAARLARIKRHPELREGADRLLQRLSPRGDAGITVIAGIIKLEKAAFRADAFPALVRDKRLQDSKKKPRGPKHPKLDKWLDSALTLDPEAMSAWLWGELAEGKGGDDIRFVNGGLIIDRARLGRGGFDKRFTEARKRNR